MLNMYCPLLAGIDYNTRAVVTTFMDARSVFQLMIYYFWHCSFVIKYNVHIHKIILNFRVQ